jgi:cobaltochelatase CobS
MKKVLLVKNDESGNKVKISNVAITDDTNELIYFVPTIPGRRPTSRWFGQKPFVDLGTTYMFEGYEYSLIALAKGWEIASTTGGERKKREPKAKEETKREEAPKKEETTKEAEPKAKETTKETKRESKKEEESEVDMALKLLAMLKSNKGGTNVDETKVREIVEAYISDLCKEEEGKAKIKTIKRAKESKEAKKCMNYESILRDVQEGYNVYLYGPAGSGKSHTAEQIASDLGLKFYGQTTIQFAHDVRGYGDAAGNFVPTPFFFAFRDGGLYFQDEYDRSCAEAAIVLNTALANGYYDFPVVGRVEAHENFRFMAAGNTTMTGADEQYVTGQIIDASSRDRFASMYEIGYDHDVELSIAHGDIETVEFVEDVRRAISESGIQHVVSYRATAYMINRKDDKRATLLRGVFKGLHMDEIHIIANKLKTTNNAWTKEARKL